MKIAASKLKQLIPLDRLKDVAAEVLIRQASLKRLRRGATVFHIGDTSPYTFYLLKGELTLTGKDGRGSRLSAGTEQALHPFGSLVPRLVEAVVVSGSAIVLRMDRDLLEKELTWGLSADNAQVSINDLSGLNGSNADWVPSLLHTPVFFRLPMANVQALFNKFEEIVKNAGDTVIREGDPGDYYYVLRSGRCRVVRYIEDAEVTLDHLRAPDGFGDEALISDRPRSASVIMESDGVLMRLAKQDFLTLMQEPVVKCMDFDTAIRLLMEERARLIDVRTEDEFRGGHLPDARNIPMYLLYLKSQSFVEGRRYVVYCDSGNRARAAAFLLTQRGFDAYLLEGSGAALAEYRTDI